MIVFRTIDSMLLQCPKPLGYALGELVIIFFYTSIGCYRSLRYRHTSVQYKVSTLHRVAHKTTRCCKKMNLHKSLTVTVHRPLCTGTSSRISGRNIARTTLLNSIVNTVHVRSWKAIIQVSEIRRSFLQRYSIYCLCNLY